MKRFGMVLLFLSALAFADNLEVLPFDEVIQRAVERSTAVGSEQAQLKSLEASNLPKHLTYLPSVSLEASHTVSDVGPVTQTTRSYGAVARMNIFKFGADRATIRQANFSEESQKQNVRDTVLKAENQIIRVLTAFISSKQRVDILKELVDVRSRAQEIARERYAKGLLSQQEVSMIEVDHDNSLAQLRDAETELVSAEANLYASAGPLTTQAVWPWLTAFENTHLTEADIKELKNRPDWKAADAQVKAAEASASASWGRIFPSLDLEASYGHIHNVTASSKNNQLTGSLTLTIPLFDKLSNYGSYRAAVWSRARSEYEREQVIRNARSSWETARGAFTIALETAKNRQKTVAVTEKVYKDDLLRFQKGAISVNDVNITLTRVLNSRVLAVQGWAQAHEQFADLCHSVGRRIRSCLAEAGK